MIDPTDPNGSPQRAHTIIVSAGADTAVRLADELRRLADRIERGEITHGCIGGPDAGSIYSYKEDPAMSHDVYFRAVDAWLKARKSEPPAQVGRAGVVA